MKRILINIGVVAFVALLAACGTSRSALSGRQTAAPKTSKSHAAKASQTALAYVQQVSDLQLYQKNISGSMSFSIKAGSLDHTVPGTLRMRKDEVIRLQIQLPFIGSEVARLEFTPSYVLVIDRIHKEYIKADYTELDFLRQNGLNFYSLQALFWNQLLIPGNKKVTEGDLNRFGADVQASSSTIPVTLRQGQMSYQWNTDRHSHRILSTVVRYQSKAHGVSTLTWNYGGFKAVGAKMFPSRQSFRFTTTATKKARQAEVTIDMDDISTRADWESRSQVSSRYKKVEAKDVLGKILQL